MSDTDELPKINENYAGAYASAVAQSLSAILKSASTFEASFKGRVGSLSAEDLKQALINYEAIQTAASRLQQFEDFVRLKYEIGGRLAHISELKEQLMEAVGFFASEAVALSKGRLTALAEDLRFSEFGSTLRRFQFEKNYFGPPLSRSERQRHAEMLEFHGANLTYSTDANRIFLSFIDTLGNSFRIGEADPFKYKNRESLLADEEVTALRRAVKAQQPVIMEYVKLRRIFAYPGNLSVHEAYKTSAFSWQDTKATALATITSLFPHHTKFADKLFAEGRIDVVPHLRGTFATASNSSDPPSVFLGFNGSLFAGQELCALLGYAGQTEVTRQAGGFRALSSVATNDVYPNILERRYWQRVGEKNPSLDAPALARDNVCEFVVTYTMLDELHRAAFELCKRKTPWNSSTLDEKWGDLQKNWYGVPSGTEKSRAWRNIGFESQQMQFVPKLYGLLAAERISQLIASDERGALTKLETFIKSLGTDTPLKSLAIFGFDTTDSKFWQDSLSDITEAVRQRRVIPRLSAPPGGVT